MKPIPDILKINDLKKVEKDISKFIKDEIFDEFEKKGAIIGLSGGIDSAVIAGLCAKSLDPDKIMGVIMPEKESDIQSQILAGKVADQFNFKSETIDITKILESFGVYDKKEKIVKNKFRDFNESCRYRLVVPSKLDNNVGMPYLEILDSENKKHKIKISANEFLTLTAATSIKHRVRMTLLYYFAEKNNFAVIGTTNKSEYQQGYFVKYGDGGSDIEPLVNLYKSQIFQLGESLCIPNEICSKDASPDVWSFSTSDEEFFYSVPYDVVDLILYAIENNLSKENIQMISNLTIDNVETLIKTQQQKQRKSKHMREIPHSWVPNFA